MRGYGNVVAIEHDDGLQTRYAHTAKNFVRVGEWVEQGEPIARVGSTGNATTPHLHFELRQAGTARDPLVWLPLANADRPTEADLRRGLADMRDGAEALNATLEGK